MSKHGQEPQHEQYNIGVKVLIVQGGRLLFVRRRDRDVWELPGGRINRGEDLTAALKRELCEELPDARGCTVKRIVHAEQTDFVLPNGNRLMLLFFEVQTYMPDTFEVSDEHTEARWVAPAEIAALNTNSPFKQAASAVFGG